ncbi:High affinity cAMP-specific and IBMX-insensitive 3',5'-cyclic phosphodiesterase 8A, partial [Physocladia obscura]
MTATASNQVNGGLSKESAHSSFASTIFSSGPEILLEPPPSSSSYTPSSLIPTADQKQAPMYFGASHSNMSKINSNLYSSGISEEIEIIRGSIQLQMASHYVWFGAILISLHFTEWTYIYFWTFPMYLSLMTINIQTGIVNLQTHILGSTILFIIEYISLSLLRFNLPIPNFLPSQTTIYREDVLCSSIPSGILFRVITGSSSICQIGYTSVVTFSEEATLIVGIVLAALCLLSLEGYIHEYAVNLVMRSQNLTKLTRQNQSLKTKLAAAAAVAGRKDANLDLDSPITKVVKSIRMMQDSYHLDVDVMESLDYAVQILTSNQGLFTPDLDFGGGTAVDNDVKNWLNAMIVPKGDGSSSAKIVVGVGGGDIAIPALDKNSRISSISRTLPILGSNELKIAELLSTIDSWDFDLFELEKLTSSTPLYHLSMAIFEYHGFIEEFDLDEVVEIFAAMIAAAVHDVDHPGFTNAYMISSSSPLALRYNDTAVLENHHCAKAFEIMTAHPNCNILHNFSVEKFKAIRGYIVSMVLATDMANHFEFIAKFKIKVNNGMTQKNGPGISGVGGLSDKGNNGLNFDDAKDRQLTLNIFIKCGDISNAAKNLTVCKKWAGKIMDEFFKQGDEERKNGYPISMFMDRKTTSIPKCQVGFVDYVVIPLYEGLDAFLRSSNLEFVAMTNLINNRDHWKELL